MAGPLQRPRQNKLGRRMQRIHLQRVLQSCNGVVELLHLLVANSLKIDGVHILGIDRRGLLKARQRRWQIVVRMLHQTEVVPRLRAIRIKRDRLLEPLLCVAELLQRQQRDAFIRRGLRQLWILGKSCGECFCGALGKLLAHLRHSAIVEADRLRIVMRLCGARCCNQQQRPKRCRVQGCFQHASRESFQCTLAGSSHRKIRMTTMSSDPIILTSAQVPRS